LADFEGSRVHFASIDETASEVEDQAQVPGRGTQSDVTLAGDCGTWLLARQITSSLRLTLSRPNNTLLVFVFSLLQDTSFVEEGMWEKTHRIVHQFARIAPSDQRGKPLLY
jgi:hypothetical protein